MGGSFGNIGSLMVETVSLGSTWLHFRWLGFSPDQQLFSTNSSF